MDEWRRIRINEDIRGWSGKYGLRYVWDKLEPLLARITLPLEKLSSLKDMFKPWFKANKEYMHVEKYRPILPITLVTNLEQVYLRYLDVFPRKRKSIFIIFEMFNKRNGFKLAIFIY